MIEYQGQVNRPNAALGATERTITANEVVRTADTKAVAREIHHQNTLIPEQVAESVLQNFCAAAVELMSQGFALQLQSGQDVAMRILPDIHLKGGNINLKRARQLTGNQQLTEDEMVAQAGELIDKVGLKVSVRAIVQQKFTDMLDKEGYTLKRTGIVERDYNSGGSDDGSSDGDSGSSDGGTSPDTSSDSSDTDIEG